MEALAYVNQTGVCELRDNELMEVDGGGPVDWILGGLAYDLVKYVVTHPKEAKDNFTKAWNSDAPKSENKAREYWTKEYLSS
jgi:hypothetical protein